MATNSSSCQEATLTLPDNDLGDRLGIEIVGGNMYFAAFDKKTSKSILLLNEHDQIATPTTVAFVDDKVLVGEPASRQLDTNAENTFRHLDQLLGQPLDDSDIQAYAKNEKHVVVQQNNRCLLRIPNRNKYMSPEDLIALMLVEVTHVAATKYDHTFQSASWALSYEDLCFERIVRAYAEAATLAGFKDVRFYPQAAGLVNHSLYNGPCYLQPIPGPLGFIVVEAIHSRCQISVVVVDGGVTKLQDPKCPTSNRSHIARSSNLDTMLRCLESCNGFQVAGVLVTTSHSCDASRQSVIVERLRNTLQQRSRQPEVHGIECPGAACRGIVYGSSQDNTEQVIVGRPFYLINMALTPSTAPPTKVVQLFGPRDELPCHKALTLIRSEVVQGGLLLRFFARARTFSSGNYPLIEVAIEFPEDYSTNTISMEASMTSSHALWFYVRVDGDHTLASIHYNVDGIVTIDSDHLVVVDRHARDRWLPRDAIPETRLSIAAGKDGAEPCQAANKRPRYD